MLEVTVAEKTGTIESFRGQNSHPLAADIFRSLVSLTPRRLPGCQLWQNAPDSFKDVALRFTTGIEPKYIDSDTITVLLKLFKDNSKERGYCSPSNYCCRTRSKLDRMDQKDSVRKIKRCS